VVNKFANEEIQETGATPLDALYRRRFSDVERQKKGEVWKVLCSEFFSQYVAPDAAVLDVGAGYCEFINHIAARRRIAVDANPEITQFASPEVEAVCTSASDIGFLPDNSIDVAFSSNFFEHLPNKAALTALVAELHRVLRAGGRLIVMGPNIAYVDGRYWDYYDHYIPLTEKSVEELLTTSGYRIEHSLPRFLPYTFKSKLPMWPWLVRLYLALGRISFPIFGKQFLIVAEKLSA
jgi:SAM-dependent methyltransferase